jgi:DNA-binding MarR family transcriptional regulator
MTTRWLDERERIAWVRLNSVVELLPGVLDSQLRRDADLTHFEYWVLAMLSEEPGRTLRMTGLAARTNATLPRLSHVVARLEARGLVERFPCPENRRATNARLTEDGWAKVVGTAPAHVENVRRHVLDVLTPEQVGQLAEITAAILTRLDPTAATTAGVDRSPGAAPDGSAAAPVLRPRLSRRLPAPSGDRLHRDGPQHDRPRVSGLVEVDGRHGWGAARQV